MLLSISEIISCVIQSQNISLSDIFYVSVVMSNAMITYIYIYILYIYVSLYLYVPDEGSLLPKYRDCTTSNDFELYLMCCGVMLQ